MGEKTPLRAVQFGAGNIGRGYMGQLFWEIGGSIVFIETDGKLVDLLNSRGSYTLRLLDAQTKKEIDLRIDRISAVLPGEEAVRALLDADVISTAVGVSNLKAIAPIVAAGIRERMKENRGPVDIYLCENMLDAAGILKGGVMDILEPDESQWALDHVGFVGTSVARMVPAAGAHKKAEDPLLVVADACHKLPYDAQALRAFPPPIEGMRPVKNFKAEIERKIFTYNLGHATLAYLGRLKGCTYMHEPFEDDYLMSVFNGALDETGEALIAMYPDDLTREEQEEIRADIDLRFSNPLLRDTVKRVARDPIRKLGRNDRLVGSAELCLRHGIFPENIAIVCAAALLYDEPDDPSSVTLQAMIRERGVGPAFKEVSGVEPSSLFGKAVLQAYGDLKARIR